MHLCAINEASPHIALAGESAEGMALLLRSPPACVGQRGGSFLNQCSDRRRYGTAGFGRKDSALLAVRRCAAPAFRGVPTALRSVGSTDSCCTANDRALPRGSRYKACDPSAAISFGSASPSNCHLSGAASASTSKFRRHGFSRIVVNLARRNEAKGEAGGFPAILPISGWTIGPWHKWVSTDSSQ